MSGFGLCKVCGETAYLEQSRPRFWGRQNRPESWKHYCSKLCRYSDNWRTARYTAYGFFIVASMFFLTGPEVLWIAVILALIGFIFFMIGNSQRDYVTRGAPKPKKPRTRRSRGSRRSASVRESTLTPIATKYALVANDPQDQLIYSNILQEEVLKCCHQTARLNDKYCVCGRALEYPNKP